ncbi:MAG: T9SS type A sorting domain-containing protein [Bacteroidetes bacterium]|nr:T9SS type A sorting domain-containing protein [Bacteroidota bacterium]
MRIKVLKRNLCERYILFIFLYLGCNSLSFGTHLFGADIFYRNIDTGKYEVTVKIYEDCNGIPLAQSTLVATCGSDTITLSNPTTVSVTDVTGIGSNCPIQSRCAGSTSPYGIEEHVFSYSLDLSSYSCCEWILSWQLCCRNSAITTGQANQNYYTQAMLNKCVVNGNSSPIFKNLPLGYLCANKDVVYNMAATDSIDLVDSFTFELVNALVADSQSATYSGPFSNVRPLTFFGWPNQNLASPAGFHLDPVSGNLSFRPTTINQLAVIVIEVTEWRTMNGVPTVIGRTRRDMQVTVISCDPAAQAPRIVVPESYQVCAGDSFSIDFPTLDSNGMDTSFIEGFHSIPGASFSSNNGQAQNATGVLHWKTDNSMIAHSPYLLTVYAWDNSCPMRMEIARSIAIYVEDSSSGPAFYAGPDRTTKVADTLFISGSDSFAKGQTAVWETLGDGYFTDTGVVQTKYIFGPNDKKQCSISIVRRPATESLCGNNRSDTMIITIDPGPLTLGVDPNNVDNGDSVNLLGNNQFDTSYKFLWSSSGDGQFSSPFSSSASYKYGSLDSLNCKVWLYLEATSTSYCKQFRDSMLMDIHTNDSLKIHVIKSINGDSIYLSHTLGAGHYIHWWGSGGKWLVDSNTFNAVYIPSASEKALGYARFLAYSQVLCQVLTDSAGVLLGPNGLPVPAGIAAPNVYPNPGKTQIHLSWDTPLDAPYFQCFDAQGRMIDLLVVQESSSHFSADIETLAPGNYWIRIQFANGQSQSVYFIKVK